MNLENLNVQELSIEDTINIEGGCDVCRTAGRVVGAIIQWLMN